MIKPAGYTELKAAKDAEQNEEYRYRMEFERMMDTGDSIAPKPIDESLGEKVFDLSDQYPEAAVYQRAEGFLMSNNLDKYSAGKRAIKLIEDGGDINEAATILNNWLPESAMWN